MSNELREDFGTVASAAERLGQNKATQSVLEVVNGLYKAGLITEAKGAALALMALNKELGEEYVTLLSKLDILSKLKK
jgi:hypothetical protein